jgi:ribosomal protein S18 acetylase RimI-like enzyme
VAGIDAPPAFQLPTALLSQGFALRPETDGDLPFLRALFVSTREQELAVTGWSAEQKLGFCDMQFDLQRRHYYTHMPNCRFDVIECHGEPMGRLYLEPRTAHFHIVDIALMPAWCGKGIGTAILEAIQETARQSGRGVDIFVEQYNPALHLYRRLGFTEIRQDGPYLEMEWNLRGGVS